MCLNELVQRDRGLCGSLDFRLFAFRRDIELRVEFGDLIGDLFVRHRFPQLKKLAHFQYFKVIAKGDRLLRQVAVYIQHAAVIVTQNPNPVGTHSFSHGRGINPVVDFLPDVIFLQET